MEKDTHTFWHMVNGLPAEWQTESENAAWVESRKPPVVTVPPVVIEPTPKPKPEPVEPATFADQTATVGQRFDLIIPGDLFPGYTGSMDASDLPAGLSYNKPTRTVSGTPTKADSRSIRVTANGGKLEYYFKITVLAAADSGPIIPGTPDVVKPDTAAAFELLELLEGTTKTTAS